MKTNYFSIQSNRYQHFYTIYQFILKAHKQETANNKCTRLKIRELLHLRSRGKHPQGYQRSSLKTPTNPRINRLPHLSFHLHSLLLPACTVQLRSAKQHVGFEAVCKALNRIPSCTPRELPHNSDCERRPGAQCWTAGDGLGVGDWHTWSKSPCHDWQIQDVLLQESGNPEDRKANPSINEHADVWGFQLPLHLPFKSRVALFTHTNINSSIQNTSNLSQDQHLNSDPQTALCAIWIWLWIWWWWLCKQYKSVNSTYEANWPTKALAIT